MATATPSRRTTPACWRARCWRPTAPSRATSAVRHWQSDWVYKMVNADARVEAAWAAVDQETRDLLTGYADGYNRYLRDTGGGALPADCRGQAWVQPITGKDSMKVLRKLLVRASTGKFVNSLVGAVPPAAAAAAAAASRRHPADGPRRAARRRRGDHHRPGRTARLQPRALRQQRRGSGGRTHRRRRGAARQPALPVVRHRTLLRRPPDDPGPLRRDGCVDLRFPAGEHRLQPQRGVEPHGFHGAPLRAA